MAFVKDENEVGIVWAKMSQSGKPYFAGVVMGQKVVAFPGKTKDGKAYIKILKEKPRDTPPGPAQGVPAEQPAAPEFNF